MTAMPHFRVLLTVALTAAGTLGLARPASAELVRFASGAVMSVASYQVAGDTAVMTLRDGSEMRLPKSSIAAVFEDEVYHPKPGDKPIETDLTLPSPLGWTRAQLQAKVDQIADLVGENDSAHAQPQRQGDFERIPLCLTGHRAHQCEAD